MAMENPPFADDFPIKASIQSRFSIATFDYLGGWNEGKFIFIRVS